MAVQITIDGKSYPCRMTMGAMLRFKQETGREVTEIKDGSVSDMGTYLWCCVASACKADKVEFDIPLLDFCDMITPDAMQSWVSEIQQGAAPAGADVKKKA